MSEENKKLDLNKVDVYIDDRDTLKTYHVELVNIVASLKGQIDRNNIQMQFFDLIEEKAGSSAPAFDDVFDWKWRKNVTYSLHRAELLLAEVTRRMGTIDG